MQYIGWVAVLLIQGAVVPGTYNSLIGSGPKLPLSMVVMLLVGLSLYLWYSIHVRNRVYVVSNSIGVFIQSVALYSIIIS